MDFQNKLFTLRKQAGLSQIQLAEHLNVFRQTISKWELGAATPDLENILKISAFFQISTDTLLQDKNGTLPQSSQRSIIPPTKASTFNLHKQLLVLFIFVALLLISGKLLHSFATMLFLALNAIIIYLLYHVGKHFILKI
ncbi:helix-turn-helix domain-containing protein [Enterococcus nangangensis]